MFPIFPCLYYFGMIEIYFKIHSNWDAVFDLIKRPFGVVVKFQFFFIKIECGLYFLDRFDVLMSKMIFKK